MKKLLLALALALVPGLAFGQCTGVFPANTLCGNLGASPAPPSAFSASSGIIGPGLSTLHGLPYWGNTAGTQLLDANGNTIAGSYTWSGANTFNGAVSGTGITNLFASPPAIGGTAPASGAFAGLTVTGSLTATGLVTNADLQHPSTTVNGQTCTLGSSCTTSLPGTYVLSHATGAWVCTAPDGSIVDTSSTTTSGIAECNSAAKSNNGNLRALCPNPGGAALTSTSDITLGGAVISYNFDGCFLNFSGGKNLTFDTMSNGSSLFWDGGQIFCGSNATTCIYIHPHTAVNTLYQFAPTYFSLPFIYVSCASNGAMSSIIDFDTTFGHTISQNTAIYAGKYNIGFVDGFDGTHDCAVAGVKVENPTDTFEAFGQNDIYIGYIQGVTTNYIQEGTSSVVQNTQALATNHWRFTIGTSGTPTNGILTYGFFDRWEGTVSINSGTLTNGINFAATTANGNWFNIPQLAGTTPVVDSSTTKLNYGFANGAGYKTGGTW